MFFGRILTPALSHPMGEGERAVAFWYFGSVRNSSNVGDATRVFENLIAPFTFSLSRRTGEGRGEGFSVLKSVFIRVHPWF